MTLVLINDKMQQGYTYELSEKEGQNFATDFTPELTPQQMLEMGVFKAITLTTASKNFPKNGLPMQDSPSLAPISNKITFKRSPAYH